MGSEAKHEIPIIDFSPENLKHPGSDSWNLVCKQVRYALEEYGCFEIYGHEVPKQLHDSIFRSAKELFELPIETKMQRTSSQPGPNYIGQFPTIPLYESLLIQNPTTLQGAESFAKIMWPHGNDRFRESVTSFSKVTAELYEIATRIIFESYGVAMHHDSHMESVIDHLRLFNYRAPEPNETNIGLNCHTDKTFITFIYQNQVEGLQVKSKDRDQYIDINPKTPTFLFIAGDGLKAWSNDKVHACEHRVIVQRARHSLGFYTTVKGLLSVPEEFVNKNNPLRYRPFDQSDYVLSIFRDEELRNSPCQIKAYAGIN